MSTDVHTPQVEPHTANTPPLRVFLCHAAPDKAAVRQLAFRLMQDGFSPWLDERELLPGQNWQREIERAVRNSDCLLVCLSRNSLRSDGFMHREIAFALEAPTGGQPLPVIPVRLEPCAVPVQLAIWHRADLFSDEGYARLVLGLGAIAPAWDQETGLSDSPN